MAITINNLTKRYGEITAVDRLPLPVPGELGSPGFDSGNARALTFWAIGAPLLAARFFPWQEQ